MRNRRLLPMLITMLSGIFVACSSVAESPEPIVIEQKYDAKVEPFSPVELDIAFRKQAVENSKIISRDGDLIACCVVFYKDFKLLEIVFEHFQSNVEANISAYGVVLLEDNQHYVLSFEERYTKSIEDQAEGFWYPTISDVSPVGYRYVVDRETLEILEFNEIPS